ncbi:MAG: hypothetical protein AB9883_07500 [Acidaminococcaceae bacterium]
MNYDSLSISMQKKTISDKLDISVKDIPILDSTFSITAFGNTFDFAIDDHNYNQIINRYDVSGSYTISDKLNIDVNGQASPAIDFTDSAQSIISKTIQKLGKTPSLNFDDFMPTGLKARDASNNCVCDETFASLIQKVLGWTDILPTTLVNVFQRGNTIYCLQRGKEAGNITLSDSVREPKISTKKLKLIYPSHRNYYLVGALNDYTADDSPDTGNADTLISGTFTEGETELVYQYGLLKTENYASNDNTKTGITTYTYNKFYPPANLTGKSATQTEIPVVTVPTLTEGMLPYRVVTQIVNASSVANSFAINGADLIKSVETTTTTTSGYNITDLNNTQAAFADEVETSTTETRYSDMGQGLWAVVAYRDGKFVSSQTITGNPGAKATPYAIKRNSTYGGRRGGNVGPKRVKLSGKFIGNLQINVSDQATLDRIAAELEWLNGKTQENVSLVYHGNLFCDFLKTITWRGNVYYLDSNNISMLPFKCQRLELVRWY